MCDPHWLLRFSSGVHLTTITYQILLHIELGQQHSKGMRTFLSGFMTYLPHFLNSIIYFWEKSIIVVYNHRSYILLLWSISKKGKLMKHLQTRSCSSIETLSISVTSNSFSSQSRSLFQVNYYFCIYNIIIVIFVLQ